MYICALRNWIALSCFSRIMGVMYLAGDKLAGIMNTLVAYNKFSKSRTSPNSAWRFRLMCFFVDNLISSTPKDVRYDAISICHFSQSDYFLVCKKIRSDIIEKHLVSFLNEISILIF